jgi:hypothetical protein
MDENESEATRAADEKGARPAEKAHGSPHDLLSSLQLLYSHLNLASIRPPPPHQPARVCPAPGYRYTSYYLPSSSCKRATLVALQFCLQICKECLFDIDICKLVAQF